MNAKEEAALKKCSERIKKDLDPTYSFLHSMTVKDVITHEEMETVMVCRKLDINYKVIHTLSGLLSYNNNND